MLRIKYNGRILNAERYGEDELILNNGKILNENEVQILSENYGDFNREDLVSRIFVALLSGETFVTDENNIRLLAQRANRYANILIEESCGRV